MGNRKAREFAKEQCDQKMWDDLKLKPWSPYQRGRARGSGSPRIQIIQVPAFTAGEFWEICELNSKWILYGAAVVQKRDPVKALGYERMDCSSEVLSSYWNRLGQLSIPLNLPVRAVAGLDGVRTELTMFGDLSSQVRYHWWNESPSIWAPLVQIANEMLENFRTMTLLEPS